MDTPIQFYYAGSGVDLPALINRDSNGVYFSEDLQQIWVGDKLIADHVDPLDIKAYLDEYEVKSINVSGTGDVISSIDFDSSTGEIVATRGSIPSIELGVGTTSTLVAHPGSEITSLNGISVSDHKVIADSQTVKLPDQISDISVIANGECDGVDLVISTTDGQSVNKSISAIKSAALEDASTFATAEDVKELSTKIDDALSGLTGAMHFLGISSTKIEDGERNHPTIAGSSVDTSTITPGDVVLYSPNGDNDYKEFVWALGPDGIGRWSELGYAADSSTIIIDGDQEISLDVNIKAGNGLTGGGNLQNGDVTLSHYMPVSRSDDGESYGISLTDPYILAGMSVDRYGHVKDVVVQSLETYIEPIIEQKLSEALTDYAKLSDLPKWLPDVEGDSTGDESVDDEDVEDQPYDPQEPSDESSDGTEN